MPKLLQVDEIESFLLEVIAKKKDFDKLKKQGKKKEDIFEIYGANFPNLKNRNIGDLIKNLGREYRDVKKKLMTSEETFEPTVRYL